MLGQALDIVFPRSCAGCAAGAWPFCDACRAELEVLAPPWCRRCGRPARRSVDRCRDCPPPPVSGARAAFAFHGPARRAIHRLKYAGWRGVGEALAGAMLASGPLPPVEAMTWVPLARRRLSERGYDQARALAVALGRQAGVPTAALLRRQVATAPQARRSGAERRAALRGAFAARGEVPRTVLLVDDVLTTGATAAACAEALVAAGARDVWLWAAARSFSGSAYTQAGPRPGLWLPGEPPR